MKIIIGVKFIQAISVAKRYGLRMNNLIGYDQIS